MASSAAPSGWLDQVLKAADLSHLLPRAKYWADVNGCRASDLSPQTAADLAWYLGLKNVPSRRLIDIILQAVHDNSLKDDDPCDPCLEVKSEDQDLDVKSESEPDQDSPDPSPSAAPCSAAEPHQAALATGQKSLDQQRCVVHDKWRDPTKMEMNSEGHYVCSAGQTCLGPKQQRSTAHLQPARSPPPRRKRRRTSDSGSRY